MKIRLVYMRTVADGFCIDEEYDIDVLPRVGDRVFLPAGHVATVTEQEPALAVGVLGVPKRYDVIGVEHRWDTVGQTPHVQITQIGNPEFTT
jgi:hypothetical protein